MTGRDRVNAALTFTEPDRLPRDLWALPYISLFHQKDLDDFMQRFSMDIGRAELAPGAGEERMHRLTKPGTYTDEWGSIWQVGEPGIIGEVKKPVLSDWTTLPHFQPPWQEIRNRDLSHVNRQCENSDQYMISAVTARPFERIQFLRGSENTFMDLAYQTNEIRSLIERVHDYYLQDIESWCRSDADGIFFMDDWGSAHSLLIHPDMWRSMFKPLYRDYCDLIHQSGKHAFFHTDGFIEPIFNDLIEVGIDAINCQLFCMNIEELGRQYKGKITFWGEMDRQHILPFGSPEDIRKAVVRVRSALYDPRGGVIAQCEWGKDNSRATIETVFQAWDE
jgi:hypothetical protein